MLLVLLLLLASCTAWQLLKDQDALTLDPDQSEGTLDGLSEAEIQKLLDDKVAEGQFMLNINTRPTLSLIHICILEILRVGNEG